MNKIITSITIIFKDFIDNYKKSPGIFWKWFIYTFLFGTIGVWVPLFYYFHLGQDNLLQRVIFSGNLSTFCIIILAETIGYYEIQKRQDISVSKAFPALINLLLFINAIIYALTIGSNSRRDFHIIGIISIFTLVIIFLSYSYRNIGTIDDAGELAKEDDARMKQPQVNLSTNEKNNPIPPKR